MSYLTRSAPLVQTSVVVFSYYSCSQKTFHESPSPAANTVSTARWRFLGNELHNYGAHFPKNSFRLPRPYCYLPQLDPGEIRETMRRQLGLPASFHLYLCPQAIFKFHPAFDDMLVSVFLTKEAVF